ncbi:MAG TPA: carboxymuconolactone decarboxylase family protein [Patescibacteria group bacterium]|nr:carboxymuconolactone decarboxylase family protein [Patescibacteria group bacterium]
MSMDNKTTALIAVGVSVGVNCQPCLDYHSEKAREYGASDQEIQTAINVGKTVKMGSAYKMDQYVNILLGIKASPAETGGGCSCGCSSC